MLIKFYWREETTAGGESCLTPDCFGWRGGILVTLTPKPQCLPSHSCHVRTETWSANVSNITQAHLTWTCPHWAWLRWQMLANCSISSICICRGKCTAAPTPQREETEKGRGGNKYSDTYQHVQLELRQTGQPWLLDRRGSAFSPGLRCVMIFRWHIPDLAALCHLCKCI